MIDLNVALENSLKKITSVERESVSIEESLGRVLAEDIISDVPNPAYNRVAMDGYAIKREDLKKDLLIVETVYAGELPQKSLNTGECSRVMTGAPLPKGADCVIMQEYVELLDENRVRFVGENTKDNISYQGEQIKQGDQLINKGEIILPQHMALMATAGKSSLGVYKKLKVGIIATGDEVIPIEQKPKNFQTRNSNNYELIGLIQTIGCEYKDYGIIKDSVDELKACLDRALGENDIVILSGGVSQGEKDYVYDLLKDITGEFIVDGLAIKPGRPTVFGTNNNKLYFGLPGNPVAVFVSFHLFVKPILYKMMGHNYQNKIFTMPLAHEIKNKNPDRDKWAPVLIEDKKVMPAYYKGSAHINSLIGSVGLVVCPKNQKKIEEGTLVDVVYTS